MHCIGRKILLDMWSECPGHAELRARNHWDWSRAHMKQNRGCDVKFRVGGVLDTRVGTLLPLELIKTPRRWKCLVWKLLLCFRPQTPCFYFIATSTMDGAKCKMCKKPLDVSGKTFTLTKKGAQNVRKAAKCRIVGINVMVGLTLHADDFFNKKSMWLSLKQRCRKSQSHQVTVLLKLYFYFEEHCFFVECQYTPTVIIRAL